MNYKIILLVSVFLSSILFGDPTPWWDVKRDLELDYPSLGDYRWIKGGDKLIVKGSGVNKRSFYLVDLLANDTIQYIDSSIFFKDEQINVLNWSLSKDGSLMLIQSKKDRVWRHSNFGTYYILDIDNQKLHSVSKNNDKLRNVKISPDNKWVAYVREDNNLYVYNIKRSREKKMTRNGSETILNGHFGWVYEEELSGYDGYRWSPDSKYIAYVEENQSSVGRYKMINELPLYPTVKEVFYPKAGNPNPRVKIGVINATQSSACCFLYSVIASRWAKACRFSSL